MRRCAYESLLAVNRASQEERLRLLTSLLDLSVDSTQVAVIVKGLSTSYESGDIVRYSRWPVALIQPPTTIAVR